ncbi:DsbA family protein [Cellulomonas endophytica]|uniref:DsbA family protein n=1 Tax=Cellulomonas endophytica TaxID=2494735 RepID=UPI001F0C0F31|nr:DsbA family protein [Cellulomonas endophytica]
MDAPAAPAEARPVDLDRHVYGDRDAPLTLVEYGDLECPYCAAAAPVLRELVDTSRGGLRLVWRHFPLFTRHPFALTAALAAEAAGERFWELQEVLLRHQDRLTDADLDAHGARLGLTGLTGAAVQHHRADVEADYRSGVAAGVRGTPTLLVDGHRYTGPLELHALRTALGLPT